MSLITRKLDLGDGYIWNGNVMNNQPHGTGTLQKNDKIIYHGQIEHGKRNGHGSASTDTYKYQGEFKDDKFHNKGILIEKIESFSTKYDGEFLDNQKHGKGKLYVFKENAQTNKVEEKLFFEGYFNKGRICNTSKDQKCKFYKLKNFTLVNHDFLANDAVFEGVIDRNNMIIDGNIIFEDEAKNCKIIATISNVFPQLEIRDISLFDYKDSNLNHQFVYETDISSSQLFSLMSEVTIDNMIFSMYFSHGHNINQYKITKSQVINNKTEFICEFSEIINTVTDTCYCKLVKLIDNMYYTYNLLPDKKHDYLMQPEYLIKEIYVSKSNIKEYKYIAWDADYTEMDSFEYKIYFDFDPVYVAREYPIENYKSYDLFEPMFSSLDILNFIIDIVVLNQSDHMHMKYDSIKKERIETNFNGSKIYSKCTGDNKGLHKGIIYNIDSMIDIRFVDGYKKYTTKITSKTNKNMYILLDAPFDTSQKLINFENPQLIGDAKFYHNNDNDNNNKIIEFKDGKAYYKLQYIDSRFKDNNLIISNISASPHNHHNEYLFKFNLFKINYLNVYNMYICKKYNPYITIHRSNKIIFTGAYIPNKDVSLIGTFTSDNIKAIGSFNHMFELCGEGTLIIKDNVNTEKYILRQGEFKRNKIVQPIYVGESIYDSEKNEYIKEGKGTLFKKEFKFSGNFIQDEIISGTKYYIEMPLYEGEFKDFLPHGHGKEYMPDGTSKEGTFKYGVLEK